MIKEKDLIMEVRGTALDLAETSGRWEKKVLASKGQSCTQTY